MLFNSIEFAIFLPLVFLLYWSRLRQNLKAQNLLILVASYVFYGWWDYRFLGLIALSSLIDYAIGFKVAQAPNKSIAKRWLSLSLLSNLGMLGVFKYYDFFVHSLMDGLGSFGMSLDWPTLNIILPVGISFYTFQTLSYTIDIYRGKLKPSQDPVTFFAFVSFFPQLVAGPIERATHLLPQFQQNRSFSRKQARQGLELILWGLFKKVVIADRLSQYIEIVFNSPENFSGITVLIATVFFAFQIYCDFSGYSDIAIGTAKLFGFDLMVNFRTPYFSRSLKEFWSRWHISLSTWFRDYVYIPLGGNRTTNARWLSNLLLTFLISGLWHGANWTFVIWGAIHGGISAFEAWLMKIGRYPRGAGWLHRGTTFIIVCLAWIFFRANNVGDAFSLIASIPDNLLSQVSSLSEFGMALRSFIGARQEFIYSMLSFGLLLSIDWLIGEENFPHLMARIPNWLRYGFYYLLAAWILYFGAFNQSAQFIYFQF
ncbi:MAG: MBOAT family O-acyltransferase [Bacteroidota bacterium]